jgi:hypothetical protein
VQSASIVAVRCESAGRLRADAQGHALRPSPAAKLSFLLLLAAAALRVLPDQGFRDRRGARVPGVALRVPASVEEPANDRPAFLLMGGTQERLNACRR